MYLNIIYYLVLFYFLMLRPCLYTFNVGGLPHLFGKWIGQVVDQCRYIHLRNGMTPDPLWEIGMAISHSNLKMATSTLGK